MWLMSIFKSDPLPNYSMSTSTETCVFSYPGNSTSPIPKIVTWTELQEIGLVQHQMASIRRDFQGQQDSQFEASSPHGWVL